MVRDDADIDEEIEIQMEKERIRMEQSERQAKIDRVNKETHSKIKRKYTSLPSNFNYDMLSNKGNLIFLSLYTLAKPSRDTNLICKRPQTL